MFFSLLLHFVEFLLLRGHRNAELVDDGEEGNLRKLQWADSRSIFYFRFDHFHLHRELPKEMGQSERMRDERLINRSAYCSGADGKTTCNKTFRVCEIVDVCRTRI